MGEAVTDETFTDALGRKYHVFTGADFNQLFGGTSGRQWDESERILIPVSAPDDKLEFPSVPDFDDYFLAARSGTVIHDVRREEPYGPQPLPKIVETDNGLRVEGIPGFTAQDLQVFVEVDWFGECWGVMEAHGWHGPKGEIGQHIIELVGREVSPCALTRAKLEFGENWGARIAELAATKVVRPLSRLWYAVNMMALYYCHRDGLRLGYLWAEYRMRMNIEKNALRGEGLVKSARDGGLAKRAAASAQTDEVIEVMKGRISEGHSIANAARLAFKSGHGSSPEANRKLWNRHK